MKYILISCIDPRAKYFKNIKDVDKFDEVINITDLVRNRPEYANGANFIDEISGVQKIESWNSLQHYLYNNKENTFVIFNPHIKSSETYRLISDLNNLKAIVHVILNIYHPSVFKLKNFIVAPFRWVKFQCTEKELRCENVYTNSIIDNMPFLKKVKSRIIKIRHNDSVDIQSKKSNIGIICDSYHPYHKEWGTKQNQGVRPKPELFYSEINRLANVLKEKYNLDRIEFCQHPNSKGEELKYVKLESHYGKTYEKISSAKYCWSFASGITIPALLLGTKYENIRLTNHYKDDFWNKYIDGRSKQLALPCIHYDGIKIKKIQYFSIKGYLIRKLNMFRYSNKYKKFSIDILNGKDSV